MNRFLVTMVALLLGTAPLAHARQAPSPDSLLVATALSAPLFATEEVLHFRLKADFKQLKKDRDEDSEERPATLSILNEDGSPVTLDVHLRTRGKFRLESRTCNFPPLRLNLQEETTANTVFAGQDKLKLVPHCQDKKDQYEQYVLQEYLLYRIYNLLTDMSFRVRLARITYVDIGEDQPDSLTKYGFLIEDEDHMAARNQATILDLEGIHQYEILRDQMTLLSVFQYFIGNTDWSVSRLHNTKLMTDLRNVPIAVPYDFDWSGAIDARYAKPDPGLGTVTVRQRVLISECRTMEEFASVSEMFREQKDAIYELYANQLDLEEKYRKKALEYYDEFYEILADEKKVRREFMRRCPDG